jgi:hypothetical protein
MCGPRAVAGDCFDLLTKLDLDAGSRPETKRKDPSLDSNADEEMTFRNQIRQDNGTTADRTTNQSFETLRPCRLSRFCRNRVASVNTPLSRVGIVSGPGVARHAAKTVLPKISYFTLCPHKNFRTSRMVCPILFYYAHSA